MVTNREFRQFLSNTFPKLDINFKSIYGFIDLADAKYLDFTEFVDLFEQVELKYGVKIPRSEYSNLTTLSKLLYYINHN